MKYSEYIPVHERPVISTVLKALIEAGKEVTINDGYEDVVVSSKIGELRAALGGTGEDYIYYRNPGDKKV